MHKAVSLEDFVPHLEVPRSWDLSVEGLPCPWLSLHSDRAARRPTASLNITKILQSYEIANEEVNFVFLIVPLLEPSTEVNDVIFERRLLIGVSLFSILCI